MAFGLARFDLTTLTARMELPGISEDPARPITLVLRFLGVGNRDWETWRFARDAVSTDDAKKPNQLRLAARRADHRDALSTLGIVGWENVLENGAPVPFGSEAVARFVAEVHDAVPATLIEIVEYAANLANFRPKPAIDPVALGKDAPRG
jgi:hypothetical protein